VPHNPPVTVPHNPPVTVPHNPPVTVPHNPPVTVAKASVFVPMASCFPRSAVTAALMMFDDPPTNKPTNVINTLFTTLLFGEAADDAEIWSEESVENVDWNSF